MGQHVGNRLTFTTSVSHLIATFGHRGLPKTIRLVAARRAVLRVSGQIITDCVKLKKLGSINLGADFSVIFESKLVVALQLPNSFVAVTIFSG